MGEGEGGGEECGHGGDRVGVGAVAARRACGVAVWGEHRHGDSPVEIGRDRIR